MKKMIPTIEELKNSTPVYPFVDGYIEDCMKEMTRLGIAGIAGIDSKTGQNKYYLKRQPTEAEADQMTAFEDDWYAKRGIPKCSASLN